MSKKELVILIFGVPEELINFKKATNRETKFEERKHLRLLGDNEILLSNMLREYYVYLPKAYDNDVYTNH